MLDLTNVKVPIKLHLPPTFSSRLQVGVLQYIHHLLLKYSSELDGIPIAINKISILDPCAVIKYDNPYFHLSVVADLTLWKLSTPNQLVSGEIKKISGDHVALIVFATVNATLLSSALRTQYFYDSFNKAWIKHSSPDELDTNKDDKLLSEHKDLSLSTTQQLEIGQMLLFYIDHISFITHDQVSIIGRLD